MSGLAMVLPVYTTAQIAHYLTNTDWENDGGERHHFPVAPGGTLTVNTGGLTAAGVFLAQTALQAWTMVSGINFQVTGLSGADIVFSDNAASNPTGGSSWWTPGGESFDGFVNVPASWLTDYGTTLDSYSFLTYMHEIGHALGLGHPGVYDGVGTYSQSGSGDNHFLNDSWQATIMSYFSPGENTFVTANWDYFGSLTGVMTPMLADIVAIRDLYGTAGTLRTGDTVYGQGSTAGGYYDTALTAKAAFTLVDNGGIDTINFSAETSNQTVDLHDGAMSSVGGLIDNMIIMPGTVIENFISGSGNDTIKGNAAANIVKGNGGTDTLLGYSGADILNGNGKNDILKGGQGHDILRGGSGHDLIWGGDGDDTLRGGTGRDKLIGGNGHDTFVFKDGWKVDVIRDFEDNIDIIELDSALWGGAAMTIADVLAGFGSVVADSSALGSHVELDFGGSDKLKVFGVTDINALLDDITIL